MDISKYFDQHGNCAALGDPYRDDRTEGVLSLLFDEDGNVKYDAYSDLRTFCYNNPVHPFSDAVQIIHAQDFARNTKGNYTAIYMWR